MVDDWDEMMMERDKRLTGRLRGQSVSQFLVPEQCCALLRDFVQVIRAARFMLTHNTSPADRSQGSNSVRDKQHLDCRKTSRAWNIMILGLLVYSSTTLCM